MSLHAGKPPNMPHEQDHRAGFGVASQVTSPSGRGFGIRKKHYQRLRDDNQLTFTPIGSPLAESSGEVDSLTTRLEDSNCTDGRVECRGNDSHNDGPPGLAVLTCNVCSTSTINLCKGCRVVGYCSPEHQKDVRIGLEHPTK